MLHMGAFLLLIVGGLNWGLVGFFNYNLVTSLLGAWPVVVAWVYVLIGVSSVFLFVTHKGDCKTCK